MPEIVSVQGDQPELRYIEDGAELRAVGEGEEPRKLVGYGAMFNSFSQDLGGFREIIRPGAFTNALNSKQDVKALINHDDHLILARRSAGTLVLEQDERGLRYEITMPNTSYARDAMENVRVRNYAGSSFAFKPRKPHGEQFRNENGKLVRELHDLDLFDVSVVTDPAYRKTVVDIRSLSAFMEEVEEEQKRTGVGMSLDMARLRLRLLSK